MTRAENEAFAKLVFHAYENSFDRDKGKTIDHFARLGKNRFVINRIITRCELTSDTKFKKLPGRRAVLSSKENVEKVEKLFNKTPTTTVRAAAEILNLSTSTVSHIKVHKLGIKGYVKQHAPKYQGTQEQRAKTGCRKIYKKSLNKVLVIDDETYVHLDPSDVPGRKFYHATNPKDVKYEDKIKPKAKFPKKILVWQAMDENGRVSRPYFAEGTINAKIYLKDCLKARLLPFLSEHHEINDVLFWPDMATSHYAKQVTGYLEEKNINFVHKADNAPNVPQARGIETFWAQCKSRYSKRKTKPKNIRGFSQIWTKIAKDVAAESGKRDMDSARRKLISIGYKGVRGALTKKTNL